MHIGKMCHSAPKVHAYRENVPSGRVLLDPLGSRSRASAITPMAGLTIGMAMTLGRQLGKELASA